MLLLVCPASAKSYRVKQGNSGTTVEEVKTPFVTKIIRTPYQTIMYRYKKQPKYGVAGFSKPITQKEMQKPATPAEVVGDAGRDTLKALEAVPGGRTVSRPMKSVWDRLPVVGNSSKKQQ